MVAAAATTGGGSAVEAPYDIAKQNSKFVRSQAPLREGSYRALASTANNFARESFMDELAALAGADARFSTNRPTTAPSVAPAAALAAEGAQVSGVVLGPQGQPTDLAKASTAL